MAHREVIVLADDFVRALTLTATPEGATGWTAKDNSPAGTPTFATISSATGELEVALDAISEAQIVTVYQNDILPFGIDNIQLMHWLLKLEGVDSDTQFVAGLAGAQNDTPDSIAQNAWFKVDGAVDLSNVVVETDDGTNDNDDIATGTTLGAVFKDLVIDFLDGTDKVRFFIENADGQRTRVAAGTTFDMSNFTGNVQPFLQLQKATGTGTPKVTIDKFMIQYKRL